MSSHLVLLYSITWLAISIIPGPTMLLSLNNGFTKNKTVISGGILGALLSSIVLILAVAIGLGALLATSEKLFTLIKWGGVTYLVWLVWSLWHTTPKAFTLPDINASVSSYTPLKAFTRSFLVTISNPKGILFFSAFLPQFMTIDHPLAPQYAALLGITIGIDTFFMICYATGGAVLAQCLTPKHLQILNRVCAIIMAILALGLALYKQSNV
ncbi:MAG: LysE family translocator [Saezia sp.]